MSPCFASVFACRCSDQQRACCSCRLPHCTSRRCQHFGDSPYCFVSKLSSSIVGDQRRVWRVFVGRSRRRRGDGELRRLLVYGIRRTVWAIAVGRVRNRFTHAVCSFDRVVRVAALCDRPSGGLACALDVRRARRRISEWGQKVFVEIVRVVRGCAVKGFVFALLFFNPLVVLCFCFCLFASFCEGRRLAHVRV